MLALVVLGASPLLAASVHNGRATASISGEVYMDSNFDGVRQPLEMGVGDCTVVLLDAAGRYVAETHTDADGYYTFGNLETAAYQLQISPAAGYIVTKNGSIHVEAAEVSAPLLVSTSLRRGIFIPLISR